MGYLPMSQKLEVVLLLVCVVVASWWVGWMTKGVVVHRQLRAELQNTKQMFKSESRITVDQAIRTLEIVLKSGDRQSILGAWELAVKSSQSADGYGAERLKELKSRVNPPD